MQVGLREVVWSEGEAEYLGDIGRIGSAMITVGDRRAKREGEDSNNVVAATKLTKVVLSVG